jgi:hypothetical protein
MVLRQLDRPLPQHHTQKADQRAPSALWRTQQALLDTWLQDSPQGQQLLRDRTLEEARETVRELLTRGLLAMQVIDLPGDHAISGVAGERTGTRP